MLSCLLKQAARKQDYIQFIAYIRLSLEQKLYSTFMSIKTSYVERINPSPLNTLTSASLFKKVVHCIYVNENVQSKGDCCCRPCINSLPRRFLIKDMQCAYAHFDKLYRVNSLRSLYINLLPRRSSIKDVQCSHVHYQKLYRED